jgi:isoleucyl-tRNA synthetase
MIMKKAFFVLAIFFCFTHSLVFAQAQKGKGKQMREQARNQKVETELGDLKTALGLNSDQESKFKTAIENRNASFKAIREEVKSKYPNKDERQKNRAQINEEFKDKRKAAHKAFKTEVNSFLNPDQQKKWKEYRNKKRQANQAKKQALEKSKKPVSDEELEQLDEDETDED